MSDHDPSHFEVLLHQVYSIFVPPKLPQAEEPESLQKCVDLSIIRSVIEASERFRVEPETGSRWHRIGDMLNKFYKYVEIPLKESRLSDDMKDMKPDDVLCLYIKAQNAGLIIRKEVSYTTFEVFEVQAQTEHVMSTPGKIIRQFPGPAVRLTNNVANDFEFIDEVANILYQMNTEVFDEAYPKTNKAGTGVRESRDSINPNYFIQYFFGFLRGFGISIDPPRYAKRLGDEVLWMNAQNPWRRSPIWLIVRIAVQTLLDSNDLYKNFMVYHHAALLSKCCKSSFSSDLLYAMRIKVAKRLDKIINIALRFVVHAAEAAANDTQGLLQGRWDDIQSTQAQSRSPNLSEVDLDSAINHTLPNTGDYLRQVFLCRSNTAVPSKFLPNHSPRLENVDDFSQYNDEALTQSFCNDPHLALFDFETSVSENLATWTSTQRDYQGACFILSSCFRQYLKAAKSYYMVDAADQSIMILTLMHIWMAIDKLAINDCPLLENYSPEIPCDILDPLLLRTSLHLEQACIIQQHISTRFRNALVNNSSIFSEDPTSTCFAIQFFNSSPRHQEMKREIEEDAQRKKDNKIQELAEKNAKHARLDSEIQGMSCEYHYTDGWRSHVRSCSRCYKVRQRNNIEIQPYEWPLPRHELAAKVAVFELDRPRSFTIWRDITYELLVDFGTSSSRSQCNHAGGTIEEYSPLSLWASAFSSSSRVTVASETKSFMQAHYSASISIPATESSVCVNNGLNFKLYDKIAEAWGTGPFPDVLFSTFGTFKLPSKSPYQYLDYAIQRTTHTSNQVLADQCDCPKDLSLHEHIAFGTLRSGARLQWMNIVRGLEENLLTFNAEEVWLIHTQASWQIGPLSEDGSRQWHNELDVSEFGMLLISQCMQMLDRVKANWLQAKSLSIIGRRVKIYQLITG
ncbi:hypothetical protein RSOLAG1IB_11529 [Rhizoctonia solani AG-1 IB]|uniref:DUF6606 domain-containing protein n=1 Tax=Thanatephorus cucumeris (strain AG1-IB / isolate 7/3/14) TaxID=1108050 RepID=A0A0B7FCQ4_THACB|nr:hypothetical protein RSOLAG1IB_11529 [Rhizoctonia solani AG-1 IB]